MDVTLNQTDLEDLKKAVQLLEQDTITEKITKVVGKPLDYLMNKLPDGFHDSLHDGVKVALEKAADAALWSLDNDPKREASTKTNKFFAAVSGAVGGAFGITALLVELPVSTTIMLRSVADIARSEGFDLSDPFVKHYCIEVFALGSPSEDDDAVETAYYASRGFTAEAMQILSKELADIASKNLANNITPKQTGKWLAVLIEKVAARFGIVITEKAAAQVVPIIGGIAGASLNVMFTDFYQDMARGHFIVKRLEGKYGPELVKAEYEKLAKAF